MRDAAPFDVAYDYDCHRKRNVALLRHRHWWLSTVIAPSRCRCTARSAHPSRTSHAASGPRGDRLTLLHPSPPTFNSAFIKLQPSAKTVPNEIIPCRRVLFTSCYFPCLGKKSTETYEIQRSTAFFIKAQNLSPFWDRLMKSTHSHHISLLSILILSSRLRLGLQS